MRKFKISIHFEMSVRITEEKVHLVFIKSSETRTIRCVPMMLNIKMYTCKKKYRFLILQRKKRMKRKRSDHGVPHVSKFGKKRVICNNTMYLYSYVKYGIYIAYM